LAANVRQDVRVETFRIPGPEMWGRWQRDTERQGDRDTERQRERKRERERERERERDAMLEKHEDQAGELL